MSDMADRTSHPTVGRHHPVVVRLDRERAEDAQLRLADRITAFAGSMPFVWLHVAMFAALDGRCSSEARGRR